MFRTRLRPLTFTVPKPLVEFVNKPILLHQIEALVKVGVTEVILTINYQPEIIREVSAQWENELGIKITLVKEDEPLGTAGCLANCLEQLPYLKEEYNDEPIFVLNADVTCSFPFEEMLDFHNDHSGTVTMLVKEVENWSSYGVVVHTPRGRIEKFVEKPKVFVGNKINAGIYIMEPDFLKELPLRPCSIEKEIFPNLVQKELLYAFTLDSFWCDLGQPKDFISGTKMYLEYQNQQKVIHPSATLGVGCEIINSVIGANCSIGDYVRLEDSVLLEASSVGSASYIKSSIIGWDSVIGKWCHIYNTCVLGKDVSISDGVILNNTHILPHKSVTESVLEPNKIIM